IVIVFCIDPVGTFTACTMNVMPNRAMTTVTTADSKYSRQTVFGGPCTGAGAGGVFLSWPLRLMRREKEKGLASVVVSVSPLLTLLVVGLLAIKKHPRYVTCTGQVSALPLNSLLPLRDPAPSLPTP